MFLLEIQLDFYIYRNNHLMYIRKKQSSFGLVFLVSFFYRNSVITVFKLF